VDHVWVLGEDGGTGVRDFPGNYSQYRDARSEEAKARQRAHALTASKKPATLEIKGDYTQRLSYKEKLEFEGLEAAIAALERKRDDLNGQLQCESNHERLQELGLAIGEITAKLDEAEMRWLELSERA
jgi:ATP-binding cassette subfamily F protein uup